METEDAARVWRTVLEWLLAGVAAAIIAWSVKHYMYAQLEIHNISMQNTLYDGQRLIEDKWSYHFHQPHRGDIVIIDGPESDIRLIKRVIGLPGDELDIRDGQVFINGTALPEPYAKGRTEPNGITVPFVIGQGELFVMGDNRENSMDSRTLGPIAFTSIEGKAVFRMWPFRQFGFID
ncbi:signal peptidase I [Paenibacillus protaetiae]|uniref:Signal peptidase I n=1 Tax=Paenibacillus protaetiae TaxID=2509456 RepID=A0A4P6ESX4_9BACL|nr:signal peptidase I [Paenibacillus protaetiae]QAY65676.1 signal peptidase I [Paenibacillus protaetiae]